MSSIRRNLDQQGHHIHTKCLYLPLAAASYLQSHAGLSAAELPPGTIHFSFYSGWMGF